MSQIIVESDRSEHCFLIAIVCLQSYRFRYKWHR